MVELSMQQNPMFSSAIEGSPSGNSSSFHASLSSMLLAVRRDRSSFTEKVSECLRRVSSAQGDF